MAIELKLTEQETKILNYLSTRSGQNLELKELNKFFKDPTTVKIKSIQKSISEIKRKFISVNLPVPFNVTFLKIDDKCQNCGEIYSGTWSDRLHECPKKKDKPENLINEKQNLVQIKKTPDGNLSTELDKHPAQIDFAPDPLGFKKVKTKYGMYQLNDSEWDVFKYFYQNPGKLITISELKDKVMYPNYGSRLPARWFDAIMRVINNLRRQVVGLDKRLLTVKGTETSYLFQ